VLSGRIAAAGAERYRVSRMYTGGMSDRGLNPLAGSPAARRTRNCRSRPEKAAPAGGGVCAAYDGFDQVIVWFCP
jgi:hypothetical protein